MNHGIILGGYSLASHKETFINRSPGSYRIASYCRELGWDMDVVDYITLWDHKELFDYLCQLIEKKQTKFIGVSYNWLVGISNNILDLFSSLKLKFPNLITLVGGQTPFNTDLSADWYVYGYGEEALDAILKYEFAEGDTPISIAKFDGRYVNAVKDYPSISSKVYNIKYTERDLLDDRDVISLEMSRGCKFKCSYCNYPFIGFKKDTSTEEEILYAELNENYQKWGTTTYIIADDTYNDRMEKMIKLRNVVKRLDFEPNFACFIRADLLSTNPDAIKVLTESRVWSHYYGIETFNRESGRAIGKGMDPNRIKDAILSTREYMLSEIDAYRGTVGMIAGLPGESPESWQQSEDWFDEHWSDQNRLWWALQITNDNDNLSAFGQNLKKYGYRKWWGPTPTDMTIDEVHKQSENNIVWENDLTNIFEAFKYCSKIKEKKQPLDSFTTMGYVPHFGVLGAQKFIYNSETKIINDQWNEVALPRVDRYIQGKKLHL